MRVLIVEDELVTRRLFERALAHLGHEVFSCDSGEAAWELCQKQQFSLIILDWLLPVMDGLELCRRIRRQPWSDRCIILVATVREGEEELQQALEAGADDYLKKPLDLGLLDVRLHIAAKRVEVLEVRQRAEARAEQVLAQLEHSQEDHLAVLNQLQLGTVLTDEQGRISFLNQRARQVFFGNTRPVTENHSWEELLPLTQQDKAQLKELCAQAPHPRRRLQAQVEGVGGRRYWMEIHVRDDPRDPRRKIFYFYDMSEVEDLRRLLDGKVQFHDLVGKSRPMQLIYEQIRQVADIDTTVLIEGETGTGKELVARAVHFSSHRQAEPFIALNCAGLTESLVGSQLFGHRRGAFTGAVEDRQGVLEAAAGGTLLLDEIGDIPLNTQASLLRVLEEKEVTRLGDTKPRSVDVRILAATHRNLESEVEKGNFRQDLFYRIRVARIQLPPLRRRREDVPLLAAAFLRKIGAAVGKRVDGLSQLALQALMDYSWPGNVRELANAVEFAVVRAANPVVHMEDLPPEVVHPERRSPMSSQLVDEGERIAAALEQAGGNRSRAAQLLGISRATLYRRLAHLDLG